jgi:hypothetical protein
MPIAPTEGQTSDGGGFTWTCTEYTSGEDKSSELAVGGGSLITTEYGGVINLFGRTVDDWTTGLINSIDFGVVVYLENPTNDTLYLIDSIELEIFYDEPLDFGTLTTFGNSFRDVTREGPAVIAVGAEGLIYRSIGDVPPTWTDVSPGGSVVEDLNTVIYDQNTQKYIVGGSNGVILTSTDGGLTWNRELRDTDQIIIDAVIVNNEVTFVGSNEISLSGPVVNIGTNLLTLGTTEVSLFPSPD